ncbi:beta-galactosidase GalA [Duganella sp. Leaf126]|uniref:beta-galactosidase GalA n=1 Tax=Duganella sp. Leaf126 TaxID=1736266 RepID=UPI0012E2F202|nr:beta-galactosidase GalA [Duganella sp. Leaf126]
MSATAVSAATATASPASSASSASSASAGRERLSLDRGWLFHLGDITSPEVKGHGASYGYGKAGFAWGPAGTTYDDGDWRKLALPHDWAVEGPFDPNGNLAQGYRPRGVGWYRRYVRLEPAERGRQFELQLDAIATNATVWVNGILVHRNWSGYNGNNINITPYMRYGDELNTIAVRADAVPMEGWWYEGAGIYRHAWLVKRAPLHVVTDGVHAVPRLGRDGRWTIPVAVTLRNGGHAPAAAVVEVQLHDPVGKLVASRRNTVAVPVLAQAVSTLPLTVARPALWSLETPQLYRVTTRVLQDGKAVDEVSLDTGLRTVRFDPARGVFLNGQHVKLQGVSIHQDHAGVGVAVPDAIWAYRLRRLKELGANAIRFTHGAIASEVLDLADRMGFLVMDENRNFNMSPDYMAQLEWLVRRDRHHPSVIMWSMFNEEPMQSTEAGYEMARNMAAAVKALDDTRPVTAAMNGGFFGKYSVGHALDVVGANYQVDVYDKFHQTFPDVPFTSSEDTSGFMTRGVYTTDHSKNVFASYDDDFATWGNSHRDAWEAIDRRPFVAGGFVWTGFDYRGEPTPNAWPSVNSVFGIMDLNGFAKTAYYLHQVQWIKSRPLVHIAPHWNWPGQEGKPVRVMVMSNAETIALSLNGRALGQQPVDPYRMNYFNVPYAPGRLEAIAYRGGREVARTSVETTGAAVRLDLVPDRDALDGDGRDAMPVTVRVLDAQGRAVPVDQSLVTFQVSGAGKSIGHGNGDPTSHEDEKGATRHLFNGLAQLIVQSHDDSAGDLVIDAAAPGLAPARLVLPVRRVAPVLAQPAVEAPFNTVNYWRLSPASATRPDPGQQLADFDMNTWEAGEPPMLRPVEAGAFRIFRASFTPRRQLADGSGTLHFLRLAGKAEIWLDGQLIGRKDEWAPAALRVKLPAGDGSRQLSVLVEGAPGQAAGVEGLVRVEPAP